MNFKIFPFGTTPDGKKIPLIDQWEAKATNDPKQISTWQQQFGSRLKGWALPVGLNGLYALDVDVKDGRNGFEYLKSKGLELPVTAWQSTPSGGAHLFFQNDPSLGLKNTVNREIGLDGRSNGGFVWLYEPHFEIPVAPIPSWLPEIVKKPANIIDPNSRTAVVLDPTISQQKFWEAIALVKNAQEGERNQKLNSAAYLIGQLVAGQAIPYDFAYAELTKAAQSIGLEPYEIQATSLSGLKGGVANPISHPFGDTPPVPAMPIIAPLPMTEVVTKTRWTPRLATLDDMTNWRNLKRPQLFEDWSPQDIILTSAVGGVGKSTLKLYESICLALGEPFLGHKCLNPGPTLFIIGEDSVEKMYAMMGRICKQMGLFESGQEHRLEAVRQNVAVRLDYELSLVGFDPKIKNFIPNIEAINSIKEAVEDLQPKQIILDPIGIFGGSEAGGNDSAKAMMQAIQKIRDLSNAAVDIVSHVGKDSSTRKDTSQFSARGATAMANHSRVVRTLLKLNAEEFKQITGEDLNEEQTAIQCFVSKFSDGSPVLDKPFLIMRDGYLFSRKEIPKMQAMSNNPQDKQRILEFVRKHSTYDKPMSSSIIADHLYMETPRISKTTTKTLISVLHHEGLLEIGEHENVTLGEWVRTT